MVLFLFNESGEDNISRMGITRQIQERLAVNHSKAIKKIGIWLGVIALKSYGIVSNIGMRIILQNPNFSAPYPLLI